MTKVLVIQGAGMNMRGKAQVEVFGTTTLEQINEQIEAYAEGLGVDAELFHDRPDPGGGRRRPDALKLDLFTPVANHKILPAARGPVFPGGIYIHGRQQTNHRDRTE